ncbi:MAG TPA: S-layer homology domain-containing protein [Clostridiales bacterium]|nr:S-layer homology domain-containing protein [Clostridiales bacterium]
MLDELEISLEEIKSTITVKTAQKNDVNQFAFTIPSAAFEYAINCNIDSIIIDMGTNSVEIYTGALKNAITDKSENIKITVDSLDNKSLSKDVSELIGNRKVIKLNISVDDKQVNEYYGRNAIKVSFDYELMQDENPDKVVAYKIINEELNIVNICAYNIYSDKITFAVDSPGTYTAMESDVTFDDIAHIDWAVIPIEALAGRRIISGIGDGKFAPDRNVTREEFAKMLVEAFGFEDETAVTGLADVPEDAWYYRYVASAQKYGIVNGIGNNMFGVGTNITRQDMAVMAYRAAKAANIRIKVINDEESFNDAEKIGEYAKDSVSVMQQSGIINGVGDNMFAPMDNATRAQAARIIYLLYKNII